MTSPSVIQFDTEIYLSYTYVLKYTVGLNIKLRLISLGLSMFGFLKVKEGKANEKAVD